jgi:hypothetical protein
LKHTTPEFWFHKPCALQSLTFIMSSYFIWAKQECMYICISLCKQQSTGTTWNKMQSAKYNIARNSNCQRTYRHNMDNYQEIVNIRKLLPKKKNPSRHMS